MIEQVGFVVKKKGRYFSHGWKGHRFFLFTWCFPIRGSLLPSLPSRCFASIDQINALFSEQGINCGHLICVEWAKLHRLGILNGLGHGTDARDGDGLRATSQQPG